MRKSILKRLILSGASLFLTLTSAGQYQEPWHIIESAFANNGLGLGVDSTYIFAGANLDHYPYSSYFLRIDRDTKQVDSLLITQRDSAAFLPFYTHVEDSLVVFIGSIYDWTKGARDPSVRKTAIVRITKDLRFKDSLVFGDRGYEVMGFLKVGKDYYLTEGTPEFWADGKLTRLDEATLEKDTSIALDISDGGHVINYLSFSHQLNKIFIVANTGKAYLVDTATWIVDSTFFPWDTSYPYGPGVEDLFSWDSTIVALARPWGMRMYHYTEKGSIVANYPITSQDTLSGTEAYIRGCYGFSDSLLVFSTSGPFTAPPPMQTQTETYVRVYAVNKQGQILWQTKIENGKNNLVHSQATDDENTFVYVRCIDGDQQKMYIYKIDNTGNVLRINGHGEVERVGIDFYPNPSTGIVYFKTNEGEPEKMKFALVDAQGRRCFEIEINSDFGEFDFSSFPTGSYNYSFSKGKSLLKSGVLILR